MRVAVFTDNDFDKVNGVTTTLKALLRYRGDTVEPRIYTAAGLDVETPDYFAAASIGVGLPWYRDMQIHWPPLRKFERALRADATEVIHVTTPGPVGLAGRILARRLGLPLTGSYHTHLAEYVEQLSGSRRIANLLETYMRWLYGRCDPLMVPSEATREMLTARGYRADRLRLWTRGVDTERFSPARASAGLRESWHVDDRRPAILYAGRLSHEKGLAVVGPIQRRLHRHGVAHQFVFVGDGPMVAELRETCPSGVFLGTCPHDRVAVAMASADVFLFPSTTDSLGNVVLEAQASALPVIVSDRGGPHEQILPDATGLVAANAHQFGSHLVRLLRDAPRRREMGAAAREYALGRRWTSAMRPLFDAWEEARGTEVFSTDLGHSVPEVPLAPNSRFLWKTPPSP